MTTAGRKLCRRADRLLSERRVRVNAIYEGSPRPWPIWATVFDVARAGDRNRLRSFSRLVVAMEFGALSGRNPWTGWLGSASLDFATECRTISLWVGLTQTFGSFAGGPDGNQGP